MNRHERKEGGLRPCGFCYWSNPLTGQWRFTPADKGEVSMATQLASTHLSASILGQAQSIEVCFHRTKLTLCQPSHTPSHSSLYQPSQTYTDPHPIHTQSC